MKTRVFSDRHIGISETDLPHMLKTIGVDSLQMLIKQVIPENILLKKNLNLPPALSENEFLKHIYEISLTNKIYRSFIGQGWYNTKSLPVVQRNILENPVWYTSYTPYQAEISQGRLEALMNFQTMVAELTSMELSNCSLLDDASAAAEAMIMMFNLRSRDQIKNEINKLFIDNKLFEHIKAVIRTRAQGRNIEIVEGDFNKIDFNDKYFGIIIQYPNSDGAIVDYSSFVKKAHEANVKVAVCADILSLTLLVPPGEWDADICFGSTQRFGIPIYFGGPSAAFFATRDEYKRSVPGRIIGFSKDAYGKTALRMALQTREQHIKRDKATSNICTSQALMATMASFYAIYHGPQGLKNIASEIFEKTKFISDTLIDKGFILENECFFDTLKIDLNGLITSEEFKIRSEEKKINVFYYKDGQIGISIDETTSYNDINDILIFLINQKLKITF